MFGKVGPVSSRFALMTPPSPVTCTMDPGLPDPGSRPVQKKQT